MKVIIDIDGVLAQAPSKDECSDIPPVHQAPWAISQLRTFGCEIICASARPKELEWITRKWLWKHFGPIDRLWFVRMKADLLGDLLVDDSPEQIKAWARTDRPYIIFDRPWNQGVQGPRAEDWHTALRMIVSRLLTAPRVNRPRSAHPW